MVINSSKGKLISNNVSRSQAIMESVSSRVNGTLTNTKKQAERSVGNTATDQDTKKVIRNTERSVAPLATIAMTAHLRHQIKSIQDAADYYVKKNGLGNDQTYAFNEMGMASKSFDAGPNPSGTIRAEQNANMDEVFTVSDKMIKERGYQDGARIPSAKHTKATFKIDENGVGHIYVKHERGISECKHIHYEAFRNSVFNAIRAKEGKNVDALNKAVTNVKHYSLLTLYGMKQGKMARKLDASGTKLGRQSLRLITSGARLDESETMKGVHIAQSLRMPVQTASKIAVHTSVGTVANTVISGMRIHTFAMALKEGSSVKTALTFATETKHMTYGTVKATIRRVISEKVNKILVNATKTTRFAELFADRAEIMKAYNGVRKSAKTELKVLYRDWMKRGFRQMTSKIPKPTVNPGSRTAAASRSVASTSRAAANKVASKLAKPKTFLTAWSKGLRNKWIHFKNSMKPIKEMLQRLMAFLRPIFAVGGGLFIGLLIMMVLSLFWDGNAAAQKKNQAFIISQNDGKAIMNSLEAQHENLLYKIDQIASNYATVDIQYPSGANENYKELFCAMQVQLEYDLSLVNDKYTVSGDPTLTDIAAELYQKTHIISTDEYEFQYDDGSVGTACHITVDIQRNETLAYSVFEGKVPSDIYSDVNNGVVPSGTTEATNWMNVCMTVKTLIAQLQPQYDQSAWVWIEVNGQKYHVRTDCSGYVSACLQVYGSTTGTYGTAALISDQKFPGFTYLPWPGWENLKQGDILVRRFKTKDKNGNTCDAGHTEVFYANSNGQHLVLSNGSTAGIQAVYPRHDNVAAYDVIYRPITSGSITDSEDTEGSVIDSVIDKKYIFRDWSRSFGENETILASNTKDVVLNPETGNENGYDTAIKMTVASGEFAPSTYSGLQNVHYVAKGKKFKEASSLDYIRYICAQHGVCADYSYDNMIENTYNTTDSLYSSYLDDSIKRTNSGIKSGENNDTEETEDLPLLQSPYAFEKGMDDLGNLQVGDIMFYVMDTGSWTSNYDNTDFNTWEVGSGRFYDALDHSVPMMYIGDGNFTYYGRSGSNVGAVRTIHVSEMEHQRCLYKKIIRYVGFTVSPVYGSTPSFCGWTDNKIGELIVLQHGTQWTEGKVHLAAFGLSEEDEKELYEMSDEDEINEWKELDANRERGDISINPFDSKDIDYSFYHEAIFEGDVYKPTDSHESKLMEEICNISIKYYSMYGILPSTAYCHMGAVSHFRSTEESLLYYNLFELYDTEGPGVNKYTYESNGDVSTTVKNYKKYSNYLSAYQGWTQYARTHGYKIDLEFAETFAEQRDAYLANGLVSADIANQMTSIYTGSSLLEEYDKAAVKRKEAIDDVVNATRIVHQSTFSTERPTYESYKQYCKNVSNLSSYIADLDAILGEQKTATAQTDHVLKNAVAVWEAANVKEQKAFQYYESHQDEYIIGMKCQGHIPTKIDPETGEEVRIPGPLRYHSDTDKTCDNREPEYEEWDRYGDYEWITPSYVNISTN